jgi:tetratricopeptide (TPR) repeat protein
MRADLIDLANTLGVPETDDVAGRIRLLLGLLNQGRPYRRWLLVFDNASGPDALRGVLPAGPGHVLVTSRSPVWEGDGGPVEVRPFGRGESVELLRQRMPALSVEDADRVAELLGDLPLAVEQAGAWLAATAMPVDRYLALVERQAVRLLAADSPAGYEQAGKLTWLLSLEQMREETPAAARLVELLAFFGPEPIPSWLLYSQALIDAVAGDDAPLRDEVNFGRLVTQATRYALVSSDEAERSMQMHRLVQVVIREDLPAETADRYRGQVHRILVAAYTVDWELPETWPAFARLLPYVISSGAQRSRQADVRQFVLDAVRLLYMRGDHTGSTDLAEATVRAWERDWSGDDPVLLTAKVHWANALRARGEYGAARRLDEQAHAGLLGTVGPQNQFSFMAMSGLAADLWVAGEYDRARQLNEQALSVSEQLFGPDHRRTLRAMNNLAVLMEHVGSYGRALRLHERTYNSRRRVLGETFPETLFSAMSYGRTLRFAGDLRGSRRVLDSAHAGCLAALRKDHPWTLRTGTELAVTLRRLGELGPALTLGRATLATYRLTRPRSHADRLACGNALALTLAAMGNHVEAMDLGMESADRHADTFGEDHPYSLAVRGNVASFLRRSGELDAARRLACDLVERITAVLGPEHPFTLQCSVIAANARAACGERVEALDIERSVFDLMAQVLGEAHPDRLVAGCNLAESRHAVGDTAELAEFRSALEATARRTLGVDHPITVAIRCGERWECEIDLSHI